MSNFYEKYILPKLTNFLCGTSPVRKQRQKIVPKCFGKVLEIGVGSGLNFEYYQSQFVDCVYALDPSSEFIQLAKQNLNDDSPDIEFIQGFAEDIPLSDNSIDSILVTYTLCTIPNLEKAFSEFRRVLKQEGKLLFCEHGLSPDEDVKKWQNRIAPIWKKVGGGCHLNRNIPMLIEDGGFEILELESMYLPGIKFVGYNFWGSAKLKTLDI